MVNRSNRCRNILTGSGTSSCSDYVEHCCCRTQCNFINDHTYTTLRKIFHQMIKDHNRSQCREKYTIFDGGNSINVRIHRSGSRGHENSKDQRYLKTGNEDRYPLQNKQNNVIDQDSRGSKSSGRKPAREGDVDFDVSNRERPMVKTKKGKNKEAREGDKDGDVFDKRNKKWKSTKRGEGEDNGYDENYNENEKKLKGRRKLSQGADIKDDRKGEREINGNTIENSKSKSKKDNIEHDTAKKGASRNFIKPGLRDDNESDENDHGREKLGNRNSKKAERKNRQFQKVETIHTDDELATHQLAKTKSGKGKNKNMQGSDDADIVSADEGIKNRKYRKGKRSKAFEDEDDNFNLDASASKGSKQNARKSKTNRKQIYRKSQGFDDFRKSKDRNYRVITNLRSKVRRGDNIELYKNGVSFNSTRNLQKLMLHKADSLQYRQTKPSRADEVKACDYLRALMEQRELCQCPCPQQSGQFCSDICIPQTCIPRCCPNAAISYYSETCGC